MKLPIDAGMRYYVHSAEWTQEGKITGDAG